MRLGGGGSLILFSLVLLFCRRFSFGCDSGVGFGVVGGGLVEQGYASLMTGCGACSADCWMSRLVVVGSPWRVSLRQYQLSDVLQRTRVQWELFDYSNGLQTVSNLIIPCPASRERSHPALHPELKSNAHFCINLDLLFVGI